jgi:hypothetical protein
LIFQIVPSLFPRRGGFLTSPCFDSGRSDVGLGPHYIPTNGWNPRENREKFRRDGQPFPFLKHLMGWIEKNHGCPGHDLGNKHPNGG